jgi:hypothetical protein
LGKVETYFRNEHNLGLLAALGSGQGDLSVLNIHWLDFGMEKMDHGRYVWTISQKGAKMGLGMRIFIVKDDDSFYCRENQASGRCQAQVRPETICSGISVGAVP